MDKRRTPGVRKNSGGAAVKSTLAVTLFLLLSKVLGLVRDMVITANFGAGTVTDAYNMAYGLPTMIQLGITACITATFIPSYTRIRKQGRRGADRFTSQMLNITMLFALVLVCVIMLFAPAVSRFIAPSYKGEVFELTVEYVRLMMPMVVFMAGMIVLQGLLNANNSYSMPQVVSLPTNIFMVVFVLLFSSDMGGISLPISAMIGFSLQFFFILPFGLRKFRYSFSFGFRSRDIRAALRLMVPALFSTGVSEVNMMVDRMLSSGLGESSVSAITYSNRLTGFVTGTVVTAILTVIYSRLSEYAADKNDRGRKKLKSTFSAGMNLMLAVLMPVTVVCYMFPRELVSVVFQRGLFDEAATDITTYAFCFYLPVMFFAAVRDMTTRMFFSLRDTKTPTVNGVISLIINILLNIILVRFLGLAGLAVASSVAIIVACGLLFLSLRRKIGRLGIKRIIRELIKLIPALVIQAVVMLIIKSFMAGHNLIFMLAATVSAGLLAFVITAYISRSQSVRELIDMIALKIAKILYKLLFARKNKKR
ncbi:MAG TPA: murein biosynthesis integral membrane protein MurJ [Ruminococcaceae bacterium]|nr:murein biosynthesis integral membrane protein MurJ [Oscillospiraceae bacterium]